MLFRSWSQAWLVLREAPSQAPEASLLVWGESIVYLSLLVDIVVYVYGDDACLTFVHSQSICQTLKKHPKYIQCPRPPPPQPDPITVTTTSVTGTGTGTSTTPFPTTTLPPTPGGNEYIVTFTNATGATEADDYLTFGLVDTIEGSLAS